MTVLGWWHMRLPFRKSSKPPVRSVNTSSQMMSLSSFLSASTAWHSPHSYLGRLCLFVIRCLKVN